MIVGAGEVRRKKQPEQEFQAQLVAMLRAALQPHCTFMFAVPNGGARRKVEAAILVGQGVVPGVPDLMVLFDGTAVGLELKAPKGRLSDAQIDVHARFARAGVPVAVVRTVDEAIGFLKQHNAPMRLVGGA